MNEIRLIGMVLVFGGASAFGFNAALHVRQTTTQLRQLLSALEMMRCELNYTMTPLPRLCRMVAGTAKGAISTLFENLSSALSQDGGIDPAQAMRSAIGRTKRLLLPDEILFSLLELGETLGKFDIDGQNSMLQITQQRLRACLEVYEKERSQRCRSYEALGICTGAALIILMI